MAARITRTLFRLQIMAKKKRKNKNAKSARVESQKPHPRIDNLELVKRFIAERPDYERMCNEVAHILKTRLRQKNIESSGVTSRAKTLNSFLEKIDRKNYSDPLQNVTDIAGVRVVSLYVDDLAKIEKIIETEFVIEEKVDKLSGKDVDQFGYGAIHFVVRLGGQNSGARYDDLKDLKCEIQTRTVLQDAWAIIQHHLVYKNESDVPRILQRKLNGLAGLLETADDQFQNLVNRRTSYVEAVRKATQDPVTFLETPINVDSLNEYLRWKFPDRHLHRNENISSEVNSHLVEKRYQSLNDLEIALNKTESEREKVSESLGRTLSSMSELILALGLTNPDFVKLPQMNRFRKLIEELSGGSKNAK